MAYQPYVVFLGGIPLTKTLAIIGGGPAGLSAAVKARELNLDVELFEKDTVGNSIRCAEGFYDGLRLLEKPEKGVRFKVKEMIVQAANVHYIDVNHFNLWMIDRKEWQEHLKNKAVELGVNVNEKHHIKPSTIPELIKKYTWIIDASGVVSVSSLYYRLSPYYKKNCAVTVQYVLEGDFSYLGDRVKLGLKPNFFGYYWIFPKGTDSLGTQTANVGIGFFPEKTKSSANLKTNIWDSLNLIIKDEGLENYRIIRKYGGLCPIRMYPKLKYDTLLLAGDAAGLTSPLHGGGLDLAVISGRLAVQTIAENQTDYYEEILHKTINPKLEVEQQICEIWQNCNFNELDHLIKAANGNYSGKTLINIIKMSGVLFSNLNTIKRFINGLHNGNWSSHVN